MKLSCWLAGTMSDFAEKFENNEALYNQARAFWRSLEGSTMWLVIIFAVCGIAFAAYYYTIYNNKPNRHYHPKYWWMHFVATFFVSLLLTLGCEYLAAAPKLDGAMSLEILIAVVNGGYAVLLYFGMSLLWWNFLPTNAYRCFKFYKS